jgi:hypothetical protein
VTVVTYRLGRGTRSSTDAGGVDGRGNWRAHPLCHAAVCGAAGLAWAVRRPHGRTEELGRAHLRAVCPEGRESHHDRSASPAAHAEERRTADLGAVCPHRRGGHHERPASAAPHAEERRTADLGAMCPRRRGRHHERSASATAQPEEGGTADLCAVRPHRRGGPFQRSRSRAHIDPAALANDGIGGEESRLLHASISGRRRCGRHSGYARTHGTARERRTCSKRRTSRDRRARTERRACRD